MITIQQLPSPCLTSDLPAAFKISAAGPVTIAINRNSQNIFETTLYPYNGTATLTNIREIIEDNLRETAHITAAYKILASTETEQDAINVDIIYCSYIIANRPADYFATHFLTTRKSFLLPSNATQQLTFLQEGTPDDNAYYTECLVKTSSAIQKVTIHERTDNSEIVTEEVNPSPILKTLQEEATKNNEDPPERLISFTVHRAGRAVTFYVTDREPDLQLQFRNCFNAWETAHLFAATTYKTEVERTEATVNKTTKFYDQQTTRSHEVQLTTLSLEHALWLNQLLESFEVKDPITGKRILITDETSEISDETNATNTLKFTWSFEDNSHSLVNPASPRIFTEQYSKQFD